MEPQPSARARSRNGLWIALGVSFLLLTIAAIVLATPVGVALGLRRAPLGAVELRTQPNAPARVKLDDVYRGIAPLRMEGVRVGPRKLSIEADGYLPVAREVDVQPGGTAQIEVSLVPDRPHPEPTALPPAAGAAAPGHAPVLPNATGTPGSAGSSADSAAEPEGEERESRRRRRRRGSDPEPSSEVPTSVGNATGATAAPAAAPNAPGNLVINSVPFAYVWVDGRDTRRTTPLVGFPLPPGLHEVQLRTAIGQVYTERVLIKAGQTSRITRRF